MTYTPPTVTDLGSVRELTLANNKVGGSPDVFTAITGGAVVGSIIPVN
jgi:hypothetical protein